MMQTTTTVPTQAWIERAPVSVHVTRGSSLPTILELGLRPASHWVDAAVGLTEEERRALVTRPRGECRTLPLASGRTVWLRDQQPLLRGSLERALVVGETLERFLGHLNDHVFLFPTEEDAQGLIARYRPIGAQVVLRFDTAVLLAEVGDRVAFARHNVGALGRVRGRRYKGCDQLVPAVAWPSAERPSGIAIGAPGLPPESLRRSLRGVIEVPAG